MGCDLRYSEQERMRLIEENNMFYDSSVDLYATIMGKQGTRSPAFLVTHELIGLLSAESKERIVILERELRDQDHALQDKNTEL